MVERVYQHLASGGKGNASMKLRLRLAGNKGGHGSTAQERPPIPPLIRRNTIYLVLVQALQGSGMQLAVTFGAVMVVRLAGSASLAGIGGSIVGFGRFVVAYPTGKLTDAYGRRIVAFIALLLGVAGGILLGFSIVLSSFAVFLVGMVALGLGGGAGMQLRVGAADMYPPARRAEGLGYVLTGSVAGAFIVPVMVRSAELLSARIGADATGMSWFLVPLVLTPAMVIIWMVRPDPKVIAANLERYWPSYQAPPTVADTNPVGGFKTFIRHKPKQVAYACSAAAQGTMSMMMVMTPLVMTDNGHNLSAISVAVSFHVAGMFAFSIPLGRLADRIGRKVLLGTGLVVEAAGAVLVPVFPYYWIITLGLFLVGIGWSAANVSSTAILADTTTPEERGRAIGTNDMFAGAFAIGTPLLGGVIVEQLGLMAVGFIGAGLGLVPLLVFSRLRERSPGRYAETPTVTSQ